ncbi:MAG: SoxR reducing system RseC family protein [Deltaproteobacteria bacterium]|nr:SoxR reducing system RseC family protein [Deltaproteobacteria bacterium]MBW2078930.1 SoxR reducing system RseC family protein [Deltaproteobacteria bacterium]
MPEEQGYVTGIREDGWAQVVTDRKDACADCGASHCCVSFRSSSEMVIKALNNAGANVGDLVSLSLSSGSLLKGAAVLYVIPLAGLMSGVIAGAGLEKWLAVGETALIVAFGFAGLILGFVMTALISRRMSAKNRLTPIITRIIRPGTRDGVVLMAVDPVCKMAMSLDDAQESYRHGDKDYYFCDRSCREFFIKSPEKYL